NGEFWFEELELQDLCALLLATGEALIHITSSECGFHFQVVHGGANVFGPGANGWSFAVYSSLSSTQEVGHRNAWYFHRVLHGQEEACLCAFVDFHFQNVFAVEQDFTAGDGVGRVSCNGLSQCGFAGPVRAHEGVSSPDLMVRLTPLRISLSP